MMKKIIMFLMGMISLSTRGTKGVLYRSNTMSWAIRTGCLFILSLVWMRASLPRIPFYQLMSFAWTGLLPLFFAFIFIEQRGGSLHSSMRCLVNTHAGSRNLNLIRFYSSKAAVADFTEPNLQIIIHPQWLTGFIDAEGSFNGFVIRNKKYQTGWEVRLCFSVDLHRKDLAILEEIKNLIGVGRISTRGPEAMQFRVQSLNELKKIIDFFDQNPLITQKHADYILFKKIYELMKNQEHRTQEGLLKIVAIKASMNKGLSPELMAAFPDVLPEQRPLVENKIVDCHEWTAGFTAGEGSFYISTTNQNYVQLWFTLTQHARDQQLMNSFIQFFGCGNIFLRKNTTASWSEFKVTKLSDILNIIIPFFKKYPIIGVKSKDFKDWCKVAEMMKEKKHLTLKGLEEIRKINARMNPRRKW